MTAPRATRPVAQKAAEWLDTASTEAIAAAFERGELAAVLGGTPPVEVTTGQQWSSADVDAATPVQIAAARLRGDLADLFDSEDGQPGGDEAA
ncbi:hypothetical protein [Frankia sp. EAN1pec]|uniref:hypothetical protein n=1 Tax=Parafrankia sp. (strain EAN1pec) TaxID=298653 RepID=UPI000314EB33